MMSDEIFKLWASVDIDIREAARNLKKLKDGAEDVADAIAETDKLSPKLKKHAAAVLKTDKNLQKQREQQWKILQSQFDEQKVEAAAKLEKKFTDAIAKEQVKRNQTLAKIEDDARKKRGEAEEKFKGQIKEREAKLRKDLSDLRKKNKEEDKNRTKPLSPRQRLMRENQEKALVRAKDKDVKAIISSKNLAIGTINETFDTKKAKQLERWAAKDAKTKAGLQEKIAASNRKIDEDFNKVKKAQLDAEKRLFKQLEQEDKKARETAKKKEAYRKQDEKLSKVLPPSKLKPDTSNIQKDVRGVKPSAAPIDRFTGRRQDIAVLRDFIPKSQKEVELAARSRKGAQQPGTKQQGLGLLPLVAQTAPTPTESKAYIREIKDARDKLDELKRTQEKTKKEQAKLKSRQEQLKKQLKAKFAIPKEVRDKLTSSAIAEAVMRQLSTARPIPSGMDPNDPRFKGQTHGLSKIEKGLQRNKRWEQTRPLFEQQMQERRRTKEQKRRQRQFDALPKEEQDAVLAKRAANRQKKLQAEKEEKARIVEAEKQAAAAKKEREANEAKAKKAKEKKDKEDKAERERQERQAIAANNKRDREAAAEKKRLENEERKRRNEEEREARRADQEFRRKYPYTYKKQEELALEERVKQRKQKRLEEIRAIPNRWERAKERAKFAFGGYEDEELAARRREDTLRGREKFAKKYGIGGMTVKGLRGAAAATGVAAVLGGVQLGAELLANALQGIFQGYLVGAKRAIEVSLEFQKSLRELNSLTKLTEPGLKRLGERIRTLSERKGIISNPVKALDSLRGLFAAGFDDLNVAEAVLEQSLKLATAGFVDQTKAAELLGSTMIAYGASAHEAARFSDALIVSTDLGLVTMEELAQSMGRVTPAAVQAGISIEEMTAVIGASTATGLRAESSIAGFAQVFKKLTNPTKAGSDAMKEFGISVTESSLRSQGLIATLIDIDKKVGGSAAAWQRVLGGNTQGRTSVLSLFDDKPGEARYDRLLKAETAVNTGQGATENRLTETMKSSLKQFELFTSKLSGTVIKLGEFIEPMVFRFVKALNGEAYPAVERLLNALVTTGFVIAESFGLTQGPAKLVETIDSITQAIKWTVDMSLKLKPLLVGLLSVLWDVVAGITEMALAVAGGLGNIVGVVTSLIEAVVAGLSFKGPAFLDALQRLWLNVKELFAKNIADFVYSFFSRIFSIIKTVVTEGYDFFSGYSSFEGAEKRLKEFANTAQVEFDRVALQQHKSFSSMTDEMINSLGIFTVTADGWIVNLTKSIEEMVKPLNELKTIAEFDAALKKITGSGGLVSSAAVPAKVLSGIATSKETAVEKRKPLEQQGEEEAARQAERRANIESGLQSIDRGLSLDEIKPEQALQQARELLSRFEGFVAGGLLEEDADFLYELRKTVFDLQKDVEENYRKHQDEKEQDARELQNIRRQMEADSLTAAGKEFELKRKQLEYEYQEKLKIKGLSKEEVDQWFKTQSKVIDEAEKEELITKKQEKEAKEEEKRLKKIEKEEDRLLKKQELEDKLRAEAEGAPLGGLAEFNQKMLLLDAEEKRYMQTEANKTLILETFAKRRAELEKQFLEEVEQKRLELLKRSEENEIAVLEAQGKTQQATMMMKEIEARERFENIRRTVEEAKLAGVSEVDIRRFVLSEQNRLLQEAKIQEQAIEDAADARKQGKKSVSGSPADPRYSADDPDAQQSAFSIGGFSIETGGERKIKERGHKYDPTSAVYSKAANIMKTLGIDTASTAQAQANIQKKKENLFGRIDPKTGKWVPIEPASANMKGTTQAAAADLEKAANKAKPEEPKAMLDINLNINGKSVFKDTASTKRPQMAYSQTKLGGFI